MRHHRLQVSNVSLNILFHFYGSAIGFRMKRMAEDSDRWGHNDFINSSVNNRRSQG